MSGAAIYSALSDEKESEQEHTADDRSEALLLDEDGLFSVKKRENLRRHMHWIFHFVSVIAVMGLLFGIQQRSTINQRKCWDLFNYYCKGVIKLLLEMNELKKLIASRPGRVWDSSCQRCSCSLPLCQSTI
jgi:hypothetical protein